MAPGMITIIRQAFKLPTSKQDRGSVCFLPVNLKSALLLGVKLYALEQVECVGHTEEATVGRKDRSLPSPVYR
jgi:hypothetical protein